MCGIAGAIALNYKGLSTEYLKPMVDVISHRGPDDAGYLLYHTGCRHERDISFELNLTDEKFKHISELLPTFESRAVQNEINSHDWDLFMGHRRLAVLDLSSAGHQPMSELSKNIWLSYNGEIYNFRELKRELHALGHRFRTGTDTEVILYAYIEWGINCLEKFNGMFALALYDNFKKTLYLARDRYGIKPLYYTLISGEHNESTLVFSSEIKSILEYKEYQRGVDYEAMVEYFTFQNIFSDRTLFKDVKLLSPGHYLKLGLREISSPTCERNFNASAIELTQYWDFNFQEPSGIKTEKDYLEEMRHLFDQAVNRQLVSDVEVGTYLSGGMDSGSISCVASKQIPDLKTFTIGFDLHSASGLELNFDERSTAEHLSYLFKTEQYEMVLKSGDMERCLPDFAWYLEEPRVGQSYPNYYAAKLAGNFVKVCLSGTGGDELYGGYPWRYYRAVVNKNFDEYVDKYYHYWQRLLSDKQLQQIFAPIRNKIGHVRTRSIFKNVFPDQAQVPKTPEEYVNQSLYFEAKTFLHGLFVVEDKLSMAHSLETRVPFMDNDLVDFAMRLPVKFKLGNLHKIVRMDENEPGNKQQKYFQDTRDGKLLLRKMMEQYVPKTIANGTKQGFSSPDKSWFRGESIKLVERILFNNSPIIYEFLEPEVVQSLILEHLEGKANRRLLIWSLLSFEYWCQIFLNGNAIDKKNSHSIQ